MLRIAQNVRLRFYNSKQQMSFSVHLKTSLSYLREILKKVKTSNKNISGLLCVH